MVHSWRIFAPLGVSTKAGEDHDDSWVEAPYGLVGDDDEGADHDTDSAHFDERGVHARYAIESDKPRAADVRTVLEILNERRRRAVLSKEASIFDAYTRAASLWFAGTPARVFEDHPPDLMVVRRVHQFIWTLTRTEEDLDWRSRLLVMQALRRALLRESVLLRILPDKADRDEGQWADLLTERFYAPLPRQSESMAHRIAAFLEDLAATSGDIAEAGSARRALYEATRLRDQQSVALVTGDTQQETRERVFAGFNTPLVPEILICTSVGQEGIDLHRQCSHVVHYDLVWNPAVLEQRTGRTDRIGSKTFRERTNQGAVGAENGPFLEIGVPFLAGTYDERIYEQLRLRAQTFEVLTGGELAAEHVDGDEAVELKGGQELQMVPLPDEVVDALRVKLQVWPEALSSTVRTREAAE